MGFFWFMFDPFHVTNDISRPGTPVTVVFVFKCHWRKNFSYMLFVSWNCLRSCIGWSCVAEMHWISHTHKKETHFDKWTQCGNIQSIDALLHLVCNITSSAYHFLPLSCLNLGDGYYPRRLIPVMKIFHKLCSNHILGGNIWTNSYKCCPVSTHTHTHSTMLHAALALHW
jgi:hypothetical protein